MNKQCKNFINYILSDAPKNDKSAVERATCERFALIKDRKVYHNQFFAVRFCYSKSKSCSFSNTVLALSVLEKYDRIPFFVVVVRKTSSNFVLLANTTFLKKISHSSQELTMENIKGSFNGSDIMRVINGKANAPENFEYLFALHDGLEWEDNLSRLVDATSNIKPTVQKFQPSSNEVENIFASINKTEAFIASGDFDVLREDLDERCKKCEREILVASHIENVNIRGRLIECLITANDQERERLIRELMDSELALPTYDTRNGLGDYCRSFGEIDALTDIKTKIIYLNSNPKAYNIDKFLQQMADGKSIFFFYFVGVDENGIFRTLLCSVYHSALIDETMLQHHWAGRSSRGVAQFNGVFIDAMLKDVSFANDIIYSKSEEFLSDLLKR